MSQNDLLKMSTVYCIQYFILILNWLHGKQKCTCSQIRDIPHVPTSAPDSSILQFNKHAGLNDYSNRRRRSKRTSNRSTGSRTRRNRSPRRATHPKRHFRVFKRPVPVRPASQFAVERTKTPRFQPTTLSSPRLATRRVVSGSRGASTISL